jgi:hypothetical protein
MSLSIDRLPPPPQALLAKTALDFRLSDRPTEIAEKQVQPRLAAGLGPTQYTAKLPTLRSIATPNSNNILPVLPRLSLRPDPASANKVQRDTSSKGGETVPDPFKKKGGFWGLVAKPGRFFTSFPVAMARALWHIFIA